VNGGVLLTYITVCVHSSGFRVRLSLPKGLINGAEHSSLVHSWLASLRLRPTTQSNLSA